MPPAVLTDNFNLLALLPEIALVLGACIVLIADAVAKDDGGPMVDRLALAVLLLPLAAIFYVAADGHSYSFGQMYVSDLMAHTLKACAVIATGIVIVYSRQYAADRAIRRGELYTLALFALLGQMVMISGWSSPSGPLAQSPYCWTTVNPCRRNMPLSCSAVT